MPQTRAIETFCKTQHTVPAPSGAWAHDPWLKRPARPSRPWVFPHNKGRSLALLPPLDPALAPLPAPTPANPTPSALSQVSPSSLRPSGQHLEQPPCLSRCVSLCSKVMASPTGAGAVRAGPCRVLSTGPGARSVWDESECTVGRGVTEVAGSTGTREGGISGLTSPSRT